MLRRAIAVGLAIALACTLAGCAIRYDQAGVSRVGVFLWGLGDPPGVNWNLHGPRREVPELPAAPRRDVLPPREPARAGNSLEFASNPSASERSITTMNDNRDRVSRRAPESNAGPVSRRADHRDDDTARR